ncbi:DNA internalization-related competence protein ComEC/Rec2 [Desulfococcaceae bacterium HSG7]|nr:DNA internalization-related competence protein ComEC/Rec2 [Desulfococcaceae bacterium HSG7]
MYPGFGKWALWGAGISALFILYHIIKDNAAGIAPLILFIALGYLSIQYLTAPSLPANDISHFADRHRQIITGVITDDPIIYPHRIKLNLRVLTLEYQNHTDSVTGIIYVTVAHNPPQLKKGDRIKFNGKMRLIRNFNNPGGFDYERYMVYKGIRVSTYVYGENVTLLGHNTDGGISASISAMRQNIIHFINTYTKGQPRAVLKALIVGERNEIRGPLRDAFQRAGVSHILAISGLHIGIIATVCFFLLQKVLHLMTPLLWYAASDKACAILTIIPVIFYGLIAGMSPSTQRAVVMITLFLIAIVKNNEYDSLSTLLWAAFLILSVTPALLFSISFQLSFAAVFSILFGFRQFEPRRATELYANFFNRFQYKVANLILVSLLAILGVLPLTMLYFNQISIVGIWMNLIIIPLIGFITIPLGLLAVFLLPFLPQAAEISLQASAAILSVALNIILGLTSFPWVAMKTFTPTHIEIACYYLLLGAVIKIIAWRYNLTDNERNMSELKPAITVIIAVLIILSVDTLYWLNDRFWRDDLRVTMIDVGQGSSYLAELPGGDCFLIDGGGFSDNSHFDIGARMIAPLLWRKKIMTVDTVVLTHPERDHLNGLVFIIDHFNVKNIWRTDDTSDTKGWKRFAQMMNKKRLPLQKFQDLPKWQFNNGVTFKILYPPDDYFRKSRYEKWRRKNNNSIVFKMEFGKVNFLFTGDIMERGEKELIRSAGSELRSSVLFAPHHGSRSSSTEPFIDKVRPAVALISCGFQNKFGFPHSEVLERYYRKGCKVMRTDLHGAVQVITNGQSLKISPLVSDFSMQEMQK